MGKVLEIVNGIPTEGTEKGVAGGYAGLDSSTRVAAINLASLAMLAAGLAGDGSDGAVDFDGTNTYPTFSTTTGAAPNLQYTLTRRIKTTTLHIGPGKVVRTAGFDVRHNGLFTNEGNLHNDGAPGVGATAGAHIATEGTQQSSRAGGGNGAAAIALQTIN